MSLTATLTLGIVAKALKALDLGTAQNPVTKTKTVALTDGTGDNEADVLFHDQRVANATPDDLDLAGVLSDAFGDTATFAELKAIYIENTNTGAGQTIAVGGAAANALDTLFSDDSDELIIQPGGAALIVAPLGGYVVTAGTADQLRIDPGANSVTYNIVLIGASS